MAYETGSATSYTDLMDKLRLFLIAQGYSVDFWAVDDGGQRLHMHKGSLYFNAKASPTGHTTVWTGGYGGYTLGFNIGTGYSAGAHWGKQPGSCAAGTINGSAPNGCGIPLPSGSIPSYQFYYDPSIEQFYGSVEVTTGIRRWFAFGSTTLKAGIWNGGQWFAACCSAGDENYPYGGAIGQGLTASHPAPLGAQGCLTSGSAPLGFTYAEVDGVAAWHSWSSVTTTGSGVRGATNLSGGQAPPVEVPVIDGLVQRLRNSMNSLSVLMPIQIFVARSMGSFSLLGSIPNIYISNIYGMTQGQPYTLGSDVYVPYAGYHVWDSNVIKKV
jgi:hypothetical protein